MRSTLRAALVTCAAAWMLTPASAQPVVTAFESLSTTDDGSVLYFAATVRPQNSDHTFHSKIYRWDATNGFQIVAEVREEIQSEFCSPGNFYTLITPQVSGDGTVLAYTGQRFPQNAALLGICIPADEAFQGVVLRNGREIRFDGKLTLTPNGRYAVTVPDLASYNASHVVTDLQSGVSNIVAGAFDNSPQRLTDEATIVTPQANASILTDRMGFTRVFQTPDDKLNVIISRSGDKLFVVSAPPRSADVSLTMIDVATAAQQPLGFASSDIAITADATGVMMNFGMALVLPHSTLKIADGIANAILSGDGRTAYVVTKNSRLLRIETATGAITELAASTPRVTAPVRIAAAGSVLNFAGSGNMRTVDFCGHPAARLPGSGNRFQVPWDLPEGDCQILIRADSPFEDGITLFIAALLPQFSALLHHDFTGLITDFNPARPGENIIAYMTGLGDLPPGFRCTVNQIPAEILYAGLTPNFPGVYQVNLRVPDRSPRNATLFCGFEDHTNTDTSIPLPIGPS